MPARRGQTPESRASAADKDIRALLKDGNKPVLRALQRAGDALTAESSELHGGEPARAELLMAAYAGVVAASAARLAALEPAIPPGYQQGGRPTVRDLTWAYETAYRQTLEQGRAATRR